MIIHDERNASRRSQSQKFFCELAQLIDAPVFAAQLHDIGAAFEQLPEHTGCIVVAHVSQIQNGVECACRLHSCNRAVGGSNSNFSELIKRSTNPMSYLPSRNSLLR